MRQKLVKHQTPKEACYCSRLKPKNASNMVLLVFCILVAPFSIVEASTIPFAPTKSITVGVRTDSPPFSYLKVSKAYEDIMPGYGGYMIEICRRVLAEIIVDGPFLGYKVNTVAVTSESRLPSLESGLVDMLCGPDSITLSRLYRYNVSQPVFLSGIAYVSVSDDKFPRRTYCGAVIGLVADTTAESQGLKILADKGSLQLFDEALESFLKAYTKNNNGISSTPVQTAIKSFKFRINPNSENDLRAVSGKMKIDPSLVKTESCPNGYDQGPVVFYETHEQGISDLCDGKILFYVADIDIIRDKVRGCKVVIKRETMTREAYGMYFRKEQLKSSFGSEFDSINWFPDSLLYSEFNNILVRKMQKSENILDYQFKNEFRDEVPTEDLKIFFEGYQFVVDY